MLRAALDVTYPLAPKLALEVRFPAPSRVLPALVRQDLSRRPVSGYPTPERFHHQLRALVVRQRVRYQIARMVIHECSQIHALLTA